MYLCPRNHQIRQHYERETETSGEGAQGRTAAAP